MNIDEVLRFGATLNEDEPKPADDQDAPGPSKRPKYEHMPASSSGASGMNKLTPEEIEKILEDSEAQPVNEVTEAEIKRLVGLLEKRYNKNQEMRIKYAEDPSKFMDSEMELFDTIKELGCVSTRPDLYNFLSKQKFVPILLSLLSHENLDLVNAVIVLLSEVLDIEEADDIETGMKLIQAFLKNQLIHLLIQTMDRCSDLNLDETEEYMTPVLEIFEFLSENEILTPVDYPADVKLMLQWLLRKIKSKPVFSASKLFASEILSVNLQNHDMNRKIFNQLNGVDSLLRVIAHYKRQDPESDEEEELMANLFNTLCASLQNSLENRKSFYDDEGLELMNLILKERRDAQSETQVRLQALKVVDHCLSIGTEDELLSQFCNKYVEILGLRVLMPIFQKPSSILPAKLRKKPEILGEVEEHSITILVALFKHCKPENILRLLNKFVESEFIKTERLVELYCKYSETVNRNDRRLPAEEYSLVFFVLQLICQLILTITTAAEAKGRSQEFTKDIKDKLCKLLKMNPTHRATFMENIKNIAKQLALEKNDQEARELVGMIDQF